MRIREKPLIDAQAIAARVAELGREISERYGESELVLAVVLKGGYLFAADLARAIALPIQIEFVRAKSYQGARSTGVVEFSVHPEGTLAGKHVLIVEDILDTGHTAAAIIDRIEALEPESLALCALLDKPSRRVRDVTADHVGFTIEDEFVVGYGLDFDERYRNLPAIYILDPE